MNRLLLLLLLLVCTLLGSAHFTTAYEFYVGGRNGWVVKPAESYDRWAESLRFQINDKLVFEYEEGDDSVLLVRKEDFDSCDTYNPLKEMDDGNSVFLLDRSGPFFFISGAPGHCAQGQKLVVVVMADRKKPVPPPPSLPPSPSPAPAVPPPCASPPTPASSPSPSPAPAVSPPSASPPAPASSLSPVPSFTPIPTPVPSSAQVIAFSWFSYVVLALLLGAAALGWLLPWI